MRRWLAAVVVIACSKQAAPSSPHITCVDCTSTKKVTPEAFATHTKLHVQTSWEGECETDIVMAGGADKTKPRRVCKQIPSDATITCDGCVVTRQFGDRYEVTLTKVGNATLRGSFRPAETRPVATAMLGPIRVAKPTRVQATCRRSTPLEASVTIELLADALKLGSDRPAVNGNNASCVDDPIAEGERLSHRYRCATPTDAPAIEIMVKTPDFSSTTTVPCAK
jgi:hypothetical protein